MNSFSTYNFRDQTTLIKFLIDINILNNAILDEYLEFFQKNTEQINKELDSYDSQDFSKIMTVINIFYKILEDVDKIIPKSVRYNIGFKVKNL